MPEKIERRESETVDRKFKRKHKNILKNISGNGLRII